MSDIFHSSEYAHKLASPKIKPKKIKENNVDESGRVGEASLAGLQVFQVAVHLHQKHLRL